MCKHEGGKGSPQLHRFGGFSRYSHGVTKNQSSRGLRKEKPNEDRWAEVKRIHGVLSSGGGGG